MVPICGLRKAAKDVKEQYGSNARKFIERDLYVADPLRSFLTEAEAIDVSKRAQCMLDKLHKEDVMKAFAVEDHLERLGSFDR